MTVAGWARLLALSTALAAAHASWPKNATLPDLAALLGKAPPPSTPGSLPPRFVGDVTCYTDAVTGDVVGVRFGADAAPLCSADGTPHTFTLPAAARLADVKVAVNKATGLVGGLAFVVKGGDLPVAVETCGARGGVAAVAGASLLPPSPPFAKVAVADVAADCRDVPQGRGRLAAAAVRAVDPPSLRAVVTAADAPPRGGPAPPPPPPPPSPPATWILYAAKTAGNIVKGVVTGGAPATFAPAYPSPLDWADVDTTPSASTVLAVPKSLSSNAYLSTDGGASWATLPTGGGAALTAAWRSGALSSDGQVVLLSSTASLQSSVDGGASFAPVTTAIGSYTSVCLNAAGDAALAAGSGVNTNFVVAGTRTGAAWAWATLYSSANLPEGVACARAPGGAGYASLQTGQLQRTPGGGASLAALAASPVATWNGIATSDDGGTVLAVAPTGVWLSRNAGASFAAVTPAAGGVTVTWYTAVVSADGGRLAVSGSGAGASGGVWTSTDAGATWTAQLTDTSYQGLAMSA